MAETAGLNWAPAACTLPTVERPLRVAEFDALFRTAARRIERLSPVHGRVTLDRDAEATARDLAARETSCCSFFDFAFTQSKEGLVMDVTVPPTQAEVLEALLAIAEAPGDV